MKKIETIGGSLATELTADELNRVSGGSTRHNSAANVFAIEIDGIPRLGIGEYAVITDFNTRLD